MSERGVRVALGDGDPFWLPKSVPGLEWSAPPQTGAVVYARIPAWLCTKHQQLQSFRYQRAFSLQSPIDTTIKDGELPMADVLTGRGALFKNDKKQPGSSQPDYRGDETITLPDGREVKLEVAGWVKEGAKGKYLSLAIKPHRDQKQPEPQRTAPQQNTYAQASGRDDRQQRPAGGPSFGDSSDIPF